MKARAHIPGVTGGNHGQDRKQELSPYRTFVVHLPISEKDFQTWKLLSVVPVHGKEAVYETDTGISHQTGFGSMNLWLCALGQMNPLS